MRWMLKSLEVNQVGISDRPLTKIDTDHALRVVKLDPRPQFLECFDVVRAWGSGSFFTRWRAGADC